MPGAAACGLAALALDFSLGGGIAFFGGRDQMLGLFLWLLPTYLVAGFVLVRARAFLTRRFGDGESWTLGGGRGGCT
jgi:hypothetical protein